MLQAADPLMLQEGIAEVGLEEVHMAPRVISLQQMDRTGMENAIVAQSGYRKIPKVARIVSAYAGDPVSGTSWKGGADGYELGL